MPLKTGRSEQTSHTIGKSLSAASAPTPDDPWTGTTSHTGQTTLDIDLHALTPWDPTPGIPHPTGHGILPRWIQHEVQQNKLRAPESRRAAAEHHICPTCFEIVISGTYDLANTPGRSLATFTVDPTPLTAQQAHACTLTGRTTYRARHQPLGGIHIIDARLLACEKTHPPPAGEILLPAHQCGARFPGFHTDPHDPETERPQHDDHDIPF